MIDVDQRPRRFRRSARTILATTALAVMGASCSSGPSASDIARDACDLARRVTRGDVGVASVFVEANTIRSKASKNNIGLSDVLSEARRTCPDIIDVLGF